MEFKKKILDNGLTVLFEKRDVPVTTVMLATKFGSGYESAEEKGIAHFIEHLCFKGTEKRTVDDISMEVEGVGGDLNAFTHEEITSYYVRLPSNHLNTAMEVLFDIFFNASFPEAEVRKEGNVILEEIKMYRDNPRMHTFEMIKKNLYGGAFGMFGAGTPKTVERLKREDLFKKHRELYVPNNAILSVVGNNSFEEVIEFARELSGEEKEFELKSFEVEERKESSEEKRESLHQTNLAIGFHFPKSSEEERYAAEIFNTILGEGMSSRLFREVREKRGLVYGVKSELDLGKNYGYMMIWAGTDPSKKEEVIEICLEEFHKMKDLTGEELEKAKVQAIGKWHVHREGSENVALNLILEEISENAGNFYKFEEKINAVSLKDVQKFAEKTKYSVFSLGP